MNQTPGVYGLVAEFDDPTAFVKAAKTVKEAGYRHFEAYSPYPIKDLFEVVPGGNPIPLIVLLGGLVGAAIAWTMEYYIAAIDYPINVGGRPLYSWPSFIPILFELTVLIASAGAFFGTLAACGFPRLNFPTFNLPEFARASQDRFFLCVESRDPLFGSSVTGALLEGTGSLGVWEIEAS